MQLSVTHVRALVRDGLLDAKRIPDTGRHGYRYEITPAAIAAYQRNVASGKLDPEHGRKRKRKKAA